MSLPTGTKTSAMIDMAFKVTLENGLIVGGEKDEWEGWAGRVWVGSSYG